MSAEQDQALHIVELRVENFMRLKAFSIRPDGSVVTVAGANGVGKSATLKAIETTMGGGRSVPDEPVRRGKRKAKTVLDLGEIVVERVYSKSGSQLTVKDRDGVKVKSPQTVLSQLFNNLSFDPLEFTRMEPQKQDEVLKRLGGLDFSELDAKRAAAYSERTDVNREAKRLSAQLDSMERFEGVPDAEVSVAGLLRELQDGEKLAAENDKAREKLSEWRQSVAAVNTTIVDDRERIARLERELADAQSDLQLHTDQLASVQAMRDTQQAEVEALTDPDLDAVRSKMASADETNQKVRANLAITELEALLDEQEQRSEQLTEAIGEIDDAKQEQIAAAKLPIEGLGFTEAGVTLDGVPFNQASTSQKICASVAIGAALNPRLRVLLIRNGNDLDQTRLALMAEMARKLNLQIWIERIEGGPGLVLIEDGALVDAEPEQRAS